MGDPGARSPADAARPVRSGSPAAMVLESPGPLDDFAALAATCTGAPCAVVALRVGDRLRPLGRYGCAADRSAGAGEPAAFPPCPPTVAAGRVLVVGASTSTSTSAAADGSSDGPAVARSGAAAYLGHPIIGPVGEVVGAVLVTDVVARDWGAPDVEAVARVARLAAPLLTGVAAGADPDTHQRFLRALPGSQDATLGAVCAMDDGTDLRLANELRDCELEVSKILSGAGAPDELISRSLAAVGQRLRWAGVELWRVDDVGQVLRRDLVWARTGDALPAGLPDRLRGGHGLAGRAWQSTQPVTVPDLATDPVTAGQLGDWGRLCCAVAVSVPRGPHPFAVLTCYSDGAAPPVGIGVAAMTGIAAHLGEFLERRRSAALAAELERTRDEYIALVGHEVRTPLTTMQSYTDLMLADPAIPVEDRTRLLSAMQRNAATLHTIVDKLLDIAGIQSGHITITTQPVDLVTILRDTVATAHPAAVERDITLRVELPAAALLWADPGRLRQVVDELFANAFTWAGDGGQISVRVAVDPATTVLTVGNSGPGIPAGERHRLFERFFRTTAARNLAIPGTGLGLSLARAIVEQHGGTIELDEPTGAGTSFTVRLPTRQPPRSAVP